MTPKEAGRLGWEKGQEWRNNNKKEILDKYYSKPKRCQKCKEILPYEKRINQFCGHSCSAAHNNKGIARHGKFVKKPCVYCGIETKNQLYCSTKCYKAHSWETLKKHIDNFGLFDLKPFSSIPKKYLLEIRGHKCENCNIMEWLGKPVPIVLDHIDGNPSNFDINNLRLLCANCDAQTPTYKGKNKGNGRHYRRIRYSAGKSF